jgi:hypothetical protein
LDDVKISMSSLLPQTRAIEMRIGGSVVRQEVVERCRSWREDDSGI